VYPPFAQRLLQHHIGVPARIKVCVRNKVRGALGDGRFGEYAGGRRCASAGNRFHESIFYDIFSSIQPNAKPFLLTPQKNGQRALTMPLTFLRQA